MEIQKPGRRRRHLPEEFKQAVIEACCELGASVAGIAMANGVNANQFRRWLRERGIEPPARTYAHARIAGRLHLAGLGSYTKEQETGKAKQSEPAKPSLGERFP